MRVFMALVLFCVSGWASSGYVEIAIDSIPSEVYVDNRLVLVNTDSHLVEAGPGKHFVSLFPPRKVYLAFKDDAPEHFWNQLRKQEAIGDEFQLLSSYEQGAVRIGTEWVYVVPDDTIPVRLSWSKAQQAYHNDSSCVLSTFLGWTMLIGAGMILSAILAQLD